MHGLGMKKTLFIHVKDKSTDFLERVYQDHENYTLVRSYLDADAMNSLIRQHEQVVMMGHGSSSGLFAPFHSHGGSIIDHMNVEALKEKDNNVFIWCYASSFAKMHNLQGFATGMFISEHAEACWALGAGKYSKQDESSIMESNHLFVTLIKKHLRDDIKTLAQCVTESYCEDNLVSDNKLTLNYNRKQLQLFE
jgi:hypothetical protein